jgi:hypothetical protein
MMIEPSSVFPRPDGPKAVRIATPLRGHGVYVLDDCKGASRCLNAERAEAERRAGLAPAEVEDEEEEAEA